MMAAVAEGSASAAAKEVEYQAGVQKLVDLLSKLNPAAKEFVPSSAAAASPPKKALSADAPVFDYHSIGAGNGVAKDSAIGAAFYAGNQQRRRGNGYINQGRRRTNDRARRADREDSIRRTVYVSELDHTLLLHSHLQQRQQRLHSHPEQQQPALSRAAAASFGLGERLQELVLSVVVGVSRIKRWAVQPNDWAVQLPVRALLPSVCVGLSSRTTGLSSFLFVHFSRAAVLHSAAQTARIMSTDRTH